MIEKEINEGNQIISNQLYETSRSIMVPKSFQFLSEKDIEHIRGFSNLIHPL